MTARGGKRVFLPLLCLIGILLFTGLGIWQVERRAWKLDLIARVDARVHAPPMPAPPSAMWPRLDPTDLEYRRVRATGRFLPDRVTLVDALTERGAGYWMVTPLQTRDGIILINRGFVPKEGAVRRPGARPREITVTGLARLSEQGGRFLRPNKPAEERWFSRDVDAIARARGLSGIAPFFIDADASSNGKGEPVGGLTVIRFRNMHLVYALTWFGLAVMSLVGLVLTLVPSLSRR